MDLQEQQRHCTQSNAFALRFVQLRHFARIDGDVRYFIIRKIKFKKKKEISWIYSFFEPGKQKCQYKICSKLGKWPKWILLGYKSTSYIVYTITIKYEKFKIFRLNSLIFNK